VRDVIIILTQVYGIGVFTDNSTVVGTQDVVGFGDNDMNLNTYMMDYPGVRSYISMTSDNCVPVVDTTRGSVDGSM